MWKERKTRRQLEKLEPDVSLMIVKSIPRTRAVRPKKNTTSNSQCLTAISETSGNVMRLCVDLMPALTAAKEPVEEEERKEEDNSKNDPSLPESVEHVPDPRDSYSGLKLDAKQPLSLQLLLPPISLPKPAAERCVHQKTKRRHEPLPPISSSEQIKTITSNLPVKDNEGDDLVTGQDPESRPWIDYPLFSKSRSAEFHLPDISLSSLDALLRTVTHKLQRKRRSGDEGQWRRFQADQLLMAVGERSRERIAQQMDHCTDDRHPANIEAMTETAVGGWHANRQNSLPPLFPATKPTLILTMTKKHLLTPNLLQ